MDYIAKTVKGGDDGGEKGRGTKLQRGGEARIEWNGEGALGGLSLHFCPGVPECQVTPLPPPACSWQSGRECSK